MLSRVGLNKTCNRIMHVYYNIPSKQSLPVHIEGHVHIPGVVQFPPLKQPAGHTAL